MKRLFYILFLFFLPTLVRSQMIWPVDSFGIVDSITFEAYSLGNFYNQTANWQADFGADAIWNCGQTSTSIVVKGSTQCLRISYPEGTCNCNGQGVDITANIPGTDADSIELYLSYDVMFSSFFDPVISGKIPGHMIVGDDWAGEHGGGPDFDEGGRWGVSWTKAYGGQPRMNWYFYYFGFSAPIGGDTEPWADPTTGGNYIFDVSKEQWVNLTIRMVCNTVDPPPDSGNYDGFAEGFVNGRFYTRWDSVKMRNVDSIANNLFILYSQFGGVGEEFETTKDEWIWTDNYYIWTYAEGVTSVPRYYERSDSSRVLHFPQEWSNAEIDTITSDTVPVISNTSSQTIDVDESFAPIYLDNWVYDGDNDDSELTWNVYDTSNFDASITDRVATITHNSYIGTEYLKFKVEDPNGNADSVVVAFTVNDTAGGVGVNQSVLINLCNEDENKPPGTIGGQFWNHFGWLEHDPGATHTLYNTEAENSGLTMKCLSGTMYTTDYGYKGSPYPDDCDTTNWRISLEDSPAIILFYGFEIGVDYRLKVYGSRTGGTWQTDITFLDTLKSYLTVENDSVYEYGIWTANDTIDTLVFATPDYGHINVIEINEFSAVEEEYEDTLDVADTLFVYELDSIIGSYLGYIGDNLVLKSFDSTDYAFWYNVNFGEGCNKVNISYICNSSYGDSLIMTLDSIDGDTVFIGTLTPTGADWYTYGTEIVVLNKTVTGVHDLYIKSNENYNVNIEWLLFYEAIETKYKFGAYTINNEGTKYKIVKR
jgi:hypothetical protein